MPDARRYRTMKASPRRFRIALITAAATSAAALLVVAFVLPFPRICRSIYCGEGFDNRFGGTWFTPLQFWVLVASCVLVASILLWGVLSRGPR